MAIADMKPFSMDSVVTFDQYCTDKHALNLHTELTKLCGSEMRSIWQISILRILLKGTLDTESPFSRIRGQTDTLELILKDVAKPIRKFDSTCKALVGTILNLHMG